MEKKAYDINLLLEHLKSQGLDLLEDSAGKIYIALMNWLEESAKISKTPFDDIILIARGQVDAIVLPKIDKINKKKDA